MVKAGAIWAKKKRKTYIMLDYTKVENKYLWVHTDRNKWLNILMEINKSIPCARESQITYVDIPLSRRQNVTPLLKYGLCIVTSFQRVQCGKREKRVLPADFSIVKMLWAQTWPCM